LPPIDFLFTAYANFWHFRACVEIAPVAFYPLALDYLCTQKVDVFPRSIAGADDASILRFMQFYLEAEGHFAFL
jgi:hypothetical protein